MRNKLLLAVGILILVTGCTRTVENDAKVSLSIPSTMNKVGAMSVPSGFDLRHIVVNVHGPQLRVFTWDANCGHNCTATPPAVINMEVPSGPGRVIQYLGAYENETTGAMIMFYGDKKVDLQAGDSTVSIDVAQYGNISAGQGNIAGQYVTSFDGVANVGRGPTAKLDVVFTPSSSAPPMVIEPAEMFNGWINAFSLKGIPIQYRFRGTQEFLKDSAGIPITFDRLSTASDAAGDTLVRFVSPNTFFVSDGGGGGRREQHGGEYIMGFFGPAAVPGAKACYTTTASLPNLWQQLSGGANLDYCSGSCATEDVRRLSVSGVSYASCSDSNMLRTEVAFKPDQIGNGKSSAAQFLGPFAKKMWSGTPFLGSCSGMTPSGYMLNQSCYMHSPPAGGGIRWNYIPEVFSGPNAITGVTIFHKIFLPACEGDGPCSNEYRQKSSDGYNCIGLANNPSWQKSADFLAATTPELLFSGELPLGSNRVAIACPFRMEGGAKVYFNSGMEFHDMRAPLPPVNGVHVRNSADMVYDTYLVDANLSSNTISAAFSTVSGAASYRVELRQMGSPVCSEVTGTSSPIAMPTCHAAMFASGPGNYEVIVTAENSEGRPIAMSNQNFTYINDPPQIASATVTGCTAWNSAVNVQVDGSVTANTGTSSINWLMSYPGTNSSSFGFTGPSMAFNFQTGMLTAGGNNYTASITFTPVHASGYQGPPYVLSGISVSAGVCP